MKHQVCMNNEERKKILTEILNVESNINRNLQLLKRFPWDSEFLVRLEKRHIINVLERFIRDEMSAQDVEAWANAIDAREDIDSTPELNQVIFDIANYFVTDPITKQYARELIRNLAEG